jgi:prepilin-type N-terminal cleavage/methylation domain-containing protein
MKQRRTNRAKLALRLFYQKKYGEAGMTIAEILVVMLIVGILAAILAPGWKTFHLNRLLTMAQDEAFQSIRQTQVAAVQSHQVWQVSFQDTANTVQWATHPATTPLNAIAWQTLLPEVRIDPALTTLAQQNTVYRLQFNQQGEINGQLGKITLRVVDTDRLKRCVITSTLLGALRKAADQDCE